MRNSQPSRTSRWKRRDNFAALLAMLCALALSGPIVRAAPPPLEQQKVDRFLDRLKLDQVRIRLLQQRLAQLTVRTEQEQLAAEIAAVYARALAAPLSDEARARLMAEVNQLLRDFPKAASVSLELQLLEADYQQAEAKVLTWLEQPEDVATEEAAKMLLQSAASRFSAVLARLDAETSRLTAIDTEMVNSSTRDEIERQIATNQQLSQRAHYFVGWSRYYLAITQLESGQADSELKAARVSFGEILNIPPGESLKEITPETLMLESLWRTRAAIGLAMTEQALGEEARASTMFGWLSHASVPTQLRDQRQFWQLQGMLNAGQTSAAVRFAETLAAEPLERPTQGIVSFWGAAARSGMRLEKNSSADQTKLAEISIARLAKLRQFDLIDQLMAKYPGAKITTTSSLYSLLIDGRRQFLAAEKSKLPEDFTRALTTLTQGIEHPEAATDLHAAGQCRYYAGWCEFRLANYEAAGTWLEQSASALADVPTLAAQALWLAAVSFHQLVETDASFATRAQSCLARLERDFPAAEQVAKAKVLRAKLLESPSTAEQVIRDLSAIPPSDAGYGDAQFEITQVHFRRWQSAVAKRESSDKLATAQQTAAENYLALATTGDATKRLQVSLQWHEVFAAMNPKMSPPQIEQATRQLRDIAAPAVAELPPGSSLVSEFHYRSLLVASAAGRTSEAFGHAQWIDREAAGSAYQLPALTILARDADAQLESATAATRAERLVEATAIYQRLVELLGSNASVVASNRNAAIASSKLARYYELAGHVEEASRLLTALVDAYPEEKKYLTRLALSHSRARQFALALPIWNRVLSGTKSGTDDWFEAKFHQLEALLATDAPQARKTWDQFRVLYPQVSSDRWKASFETLGAKFPSSAPESKPGT